MKKTKFLKETAYPAAPTLSNGFVPPVDFDYKISVDLRGRDIKIYGFTGSQWVLLHDTDGAIDDFIADIVHQKYYLESKTGSNQTVRVNFLSSLTDPNLHSFDFAVTDGSRKLHHFDDVPVYRGGDEGRFLTIRSDGSLAWLLANESYIVEAEGGGQSPSPTLLSQAVAYGDASYDASTDRMIFDGNGDYATFGGDYAFTDAITVATWFRTSSPGDRRILSSHVRSSSQFLNGWFMRLQNGQLKYRHPSGGAGELTGPSGMNNGQYQHVAMTWSPSGYVLYVNGVQYATGGASAADGYDMSFDLHIGANSWNGNSPYGFFVGRISGTIVENQVMTAGEIQAIYDNGPEYVESEGGESPAAPQASFIEDNAGFTGAVANGIYTDGGDGQGHWSQIGLSSDGVIDYTNGDPTSDEFTISWWMNLDSNQAASNLTVAGRHLGTVGGVNRNFKINLGNVGAGIANPHFQIYLGSTIMSNLNTGVAMGGNWTHCAVVCKSDGSQLVVSAYLNGNKLPGTRTKPLGTKLLLPEAYDGFGWGGNGQSGRSVKGQFDSMQIKDGIALTDAQVAAISAQADRQMGIEAASQV